MSGADMSSTKKRRLKISTEAGCFAILVPERGTVADACAAAEAIRQLGKRRVRTLALPDGCELLAGDCIADAVEDGEELRPVFEEAGAGDESEPAGAAADGAGKQRDKREIKGTTNPTPAGRMRALYSSRFVRGATRRGGLLSLSLSLPLLWPLSPSQCTSRCQTRRQRQEQRQRQRQEQRQRRKQRPGCDRQ